MTGKCNDKETIDCVGGVSDQMAYTSCIISWYCLWLGGRVLQFWESSSDPVSMDVLIGCYWLVNDAMGTAFWLYHFFSEGAISFVPTM